MLHFRHTTGQSPNKRWWCTRSSWATPAWWYPWVWWRRSSVARGPSWERCSSTDSCPYWRPGWHYWLVPHNVTTAEYRLLDVPFVCYRADGWLCVCVAWYRAWVRRAAFPVYTRCWDSGRPSRSVVASVPTYILVIFSVASCSSRAAHGLSVHFKTLAIHRNPKVVVQSIISSQVNVPLDPDRQLCRSDTTNSK